MNTTKPKDKPFHVPKLLVWEAWRQVKANKGAPGVDEQEIEQFEADLRNNLFKVWNRMSSGTWFPPPVLAVEIPKPHGAGVRVLGVPTVADRVAQTVVAKFLEPLVEPRFHQDSYGYRPGKSALDAVGVCRERCWKYNWVIDLDVQRFLASRLRSAPARGCGDTSGDTLQRPTRRTTNDDHCDHRSVPVLDSASEHPTVRGVRAGRSQTDLGAWDRALRGDRLVRRGLALPATRAGRDGAVAQDRGRGAEASGAD